ncbi:hypothetical protein A3848_12440 [Paenibacillus sp. P32E]|nr:hypothetical protein A3848_12440 [Paenibacillus sp. P32E]
MSEFKERMMMCSVEYDEMIDMAQAMRDKEWLRNWLRSKSGYVNWRLKCVVSQAYSTRIRAYSTADPRAQGETTF